MKTVSIIIPVYNVETMVSRCVESILHQTFADFELILINDGSKDSSLAVISTFSEDPRVRIIDQENRGAALTRNRGIELAEGEYIMFIDSDDWIDPDFLETYVNAMAGTDYDIIMGGYRRVTLEKTLATVQPKQGEFSPYVVVSPWAKLYRRDFIEKNKIDFLVTTGSEDVYFNVVCICSGAKIKIIENVGYHWLYNEGSLSNTIHKGFNPNVDVFEVLDKINYKNLSNQRLNEYFIIRYCIWYLLHSGRTADKKAFMEEYHKLYHWLDEKVPDHRKNKYLTTKTPKGEPLKFRMIVWIFDKIEKLHLVKLFTTVYCRGTKSE